MLTVRQILREKGNDVWSIRPTQTVYEALALMSEKNLGAIVIAEGRELRGIFSERDFARCVIQEDIDIRQTTVNTLMTSDVVTISPDKSLDDCMSIMTQERIRHIPIIEDTEIIGVVSIGDVVNRIISEQRFDLKEIKNYIAGAL